MSGCHQRLKSRESWLDGLCLTYKTEKEGSRWSRGWLATTLKLKLVFVIFFFLELSACKLLIMVAEG